MDDQTKPAWLPLTPSGVAAFAHASTGRLLLVQAIFALLTGAVVAWFLQWECFPTVSRAIEQLPADGEIRSAKLDWHGETPVMLAEGRFLALTVDLNHTGGLRSPADVQVEFGATDFRVRSLFGMLEGRYPDGWIIEFNREELKPRWGAWRPALLAGAVAGVVVSLMLTWWCVAAVYCYPVRLAAYFADRDLDLAGSWRLSCAALMPGGLVMTVGILAYGIGLLNLVALLFVFGVHWMVGWVYLILGLLCARGSSGKPSDKNPFARKTSE